MAYEDDLPDAPWASPADTSADENLTTGSVENADLPDAPWAQASPQNQLPDAPWAKAEPPEAEGTLGTVARAAGHSVLPTAGSIATMGLGAKAGALAGAPLGPWGAGAGAIAGGLIAGLGGGYLFSKAQDWVADKFGWNDTEQREANAQANPKSALVGDLLPSAAAFGPGLGKKIPWAVRAAMGAFGGGLEAAQEAVTEGEVHPGKVATAAAFQSVFADPTKLGTKLMAPGEALAERIFRPGRPGTAPPATPPLPQGSPGVAAPATPVQGAQGPGGQAQTTAPGVGNPQSAVAGSSRAGAKAPPAAAGVPMTDAIPADQQAALEAAFGGPSAVAPRPPPPPTNLPDPHLVAASNKISLSQALAEKGGRLTEPPVAPPEPAGVAGRAPPADAATEASRMHREVEADVHDKISAQQTGEQALDTYTGEQRRWQDREAAPQSKEAIQQAAASYDHPDLPNVKVVRDKDVPYLAGSSEDARTVYVDPRVPKQIDVNGMAIDPALPLAVHEIYERAGIEAIKKEIAAGKREPMTDEQIYANAHEHAGTAAERKYLMDEMGFTKEDWNRYQQIIKEIVPKTEGESAGRRAPPADLYTFMYPKGEAKALHEEGSARAGTEGPIETGLVENAPVREHKPSVKAAIDLLRERGMEDRAARIESAAPEEALLLARQARRAMGEVSQPARVEGLGVTARSKADAERKQGAIDTIKKVYEKYPPTDEQVPVSPDDIAALRDRLQKAVDEAGDAMKYKPQKRPPEWRWVAAARKFLNSRPTPKNVGEFITNEKLIRSGNAEDVAATKRINSDFELRRGPTVEQAEAKKVGVFDTSHEEAEAYVKPEPVTREELTREKVEPKEVDLSKMSSEELEKLGTALADKKLAEDIAEAEPKWKAAEEARLADQAKKTEQLRVLREAAKTAPKAEGTIGDMLKAFVKSEKASGYQVTRDPLAAQQAREPGYMARDPRNVTDERGKSAEHQERYARGVADDFHKLGQQDVEHAKGILNEINKMPEELRTDTKAKEDIYLAREAQKEGQLPADQKAWYDKYLEPIYKQNDKMYDAIEAIFPNTLGPKVTNHTMRIREGVDTDTLFGASVSDNPLDARNLKTGRKTTMHDRVFMALERDSDGKRVVISPNEDGFATWNKYKKTDIKAPLEVKPGESITIGGHKYTVVEAMTPEIEANARFENGKVAKYYHDPILSATVTNFELATTLRHMQFMHDLKQDPAFLKWATPSFEKAKANGWEHNKTELPQFAGWYMDNRVKMVMDDYAISGFKGLETMRQLSTAVTKLLFWMPTAHAMNVFAHWFVERGWDWITPKEYYHLAKEGVESIKSVVTQDARQQYQLHNGVGTILPRVQLGTTPKFMKEVGNAINLTIKDNPAQWDLIAKKFGVGPSTLGKAIYDASQKLMWGASDVMLTQAIMANERKGMNIKQAMDAAERHIPNYRIPTELIASGKFGRFLSKAMGDQAVVAFGRYHYGMINSFANIAKDLTSGHGPRQMEAVGNLMAMALLAFAVKPVLDTMAQWVTGNEKAEVYPRGPLTIPMHVVKAHQGKEDIMAAVRGMTTFSPLLSTGIETIANRDFAGRDIIDKKTFERATSGNFGAMGRAAVQAGHHAAAGLISPYGTFTQGAKAGKDPIEVIRNAALDIKDPSQKSMNYEAKRPLTNIQKEISRYKNPPSAAEQLYNRVFGF